MCVFKCVSEEGLSLPREGFVKLFTGILACSRVLVGLLEERGAVKSSPLWYLPVVVFFELQCTTFPAPIWAHT